MTTKHPQHDNLIIAANDKDALFDCEEANWHNVTIKIVTAYPEWNWTHVKPAYKYQYVKDAYEADKSLVVQCRHEYTNKLWDDSPPSWSDGMEYRIKPKTITKRLYADDLGFVKLLVLPNGNYTIPINGNETEVDIEQ